MHRAAWFFLLVVLPVRADSLKVELTVSFFPPPVFSSNSQLAGTANFYLDINGPQPTNSPAPVVFLDPWERSVTAVEDASLFDPCIVDGSCGVDTSVRGTAQGFAVFGFPDTVDLPSVQPDVAPIIPVGTLAATDPCRQHLGDPCTQSGPLVAFVDDPVVVGTWEIRMNVVPEPNGMVLFGTVILLLAIFWTALRRPSYSEKSGGYDSASGQLRRPRVLSGKTPSLAKCPQSSVPLPPRA